MNIRVAVRVWPFNQREIENKSELCIWMRDNVTEILDQTQESLYSFGFDHSFWSFDDFQVNENGVNVKNSHKSIYTDQNDVYQSLGKEVVESALQGYNCCVFAYGQTGSGKSYSVFGYENNQGIVPLFCKDIFERIQEQSSDNSFQVQISMLEIYNEKIQDLIVPIEQRTPSGLKIRENKMIGVYVEGLSKYQVEDYEEIEDIIEQGNKNKSIGATLMNATSSRAHTIIVLEIVQQQIKNKRKIQKSSQIFLVDLAGSEKVSKSGLQNDRLKEACSINKSLSQLGIVINQLYKKSQGAKGVISYWDSALTRLLSNALGGNSRTTMLCTISPAWENLEEILSTLWYANQAKMIKLQPVVNQSETDKIIKELEEENERLKKMLQDLQKKDTNQQQQEKEEIKNQINEMRSHIVQAQTGFGLNMSKIDFKTSQIFQKNRKLKNLSGVPFLTNLNEDPILNETLRYDLNEHKQILITRANNSQEQQINENQATIILNGINVFLDHAWVENKAEGVFITCNYLDPQEYTFVNGKSLLNLNTEQAEEYSIQLKNNDRIIIGTSTTFLLRLPQERWQSLNQSQRFDWEFCQQEKFQNQEKNVQLKMEQELQEKQQELNRKEQELKNKIETEKKNYEQRIKEQDQEYQNSIQNLQNELLNKNWNLNENERFIKDMKNVQKVNDLQSKQQARQKELQERLLQVRRENFLIKRRRELQQVIEKSLVNFYPKIKEANSIAKELNRRLEFYPFVDTINAVMFAEDQISKQNLLQIKLVNKEEGWINFWSLNKFEERLELIWEDLQRYFANRPDDQQEKVDPFWDPQELCLFARGFCLAKNILYKFSLEQKVSLMNTKGVVGHLQVLILAVDQNGQKINEEQIENFIEDPNDLISKETPCHFIIQIKEIIFYDISVLLNKKFNIQLSLLTSEGNWEYLSNIQTIKDNKITFEFSQFVNIESVDLNLVDFYLNWNIQVSVFTENLETVAKEGKMTPPDIMSSVLLHNPFPNQHQSNQIEMRQWSKTEYQANGQSSKGMCQIM